MPHRHCKTCRSPLHADDTHAECVSCLGKSLLQVDVKDEEGWGDHPRYDKGCQRARKSNGLRLRSHLAAGWTSDFSRGAIRHSANARPPSSPKSMTSSQNRSGHYSSRIRPSDSAALISVDGVEEKGYEHLPPLDESVAVHLCPPMAIGWKARASHPSRATSALAGCGYSAAGQAASALHSMAVLQVFQAKMLASEEAGLDAASLSDLRSGTDLALRATKATAQAIGRSISSLIVLEHHFWLMITAMNEADKVPFLDAPVSSGSLFGPALCNASQRLRSHLKRCDTSSRNAPALLLLPIILGLCRLSRQLSQCQPPLSPDLLRVGGIEGAHVRHDATPSRSAKDPGPRSPWIRRLRNPPDQPGRKRRGPSLATAVPPRKQPLMCLLPSRLALGAEESVFLVPHGLTLAPGCPTAVILDRIKHIHFHLQIHFLPLCSQSLQPFQPLATQAEVWQAIPGVSEWVMAVIRRGYTLQFARRPPRFRCVLVTTVRSKGTVPGHSYRLSSDDSLWQQLRHYFGWVCFTCDQSSSG